MKRILWLLPILTIVACNSNPAFQGEKIETVYSTVLIAPEEMDFGYENIMEDDQSNREHLRDLAKSIIDQVKSGTLKAYSTVIENQEISQKQLDEIWLKHDTIYVPDGFNFNKVPVEEVFEISDITHLRFKENWYYDSNNNLISKEVVEVCPMTASFEENGDYRGKVPMFWIKLK